MGSNDYHFVTHWRVVGTLQEVADILADGPGLARWWPSVYLAVEELTSGEAGNVAPTVSLYTKGWLPYRLRWQFQVTASNYPNGFTITAWGDFEGRGIWTFAQDGPWVDVIYDWKVRADKLLLRRMSWLMKPLFSANHHWAMKKGEESLRLELARRHATTDAERERIPAPPGPTSAARQAATLILLAVATTGIVLSFRNS